MAVRGQAGGLTASDPAGRPTKLVGAGGITVFGTEQPAHPDILTKYGKTALSLVMANLTVNTTNVQNATNPDRFSFDYSRFGTLTRKIIIDQSITPGSAYGQIRVPNLSITPDTDSDKGFSIDVYLPNHPNEFLGTGKNPNISVRLSQIANGTAGPSETWIFAATYLRQGWNTLKMRANDVISSSSSIDGEGNLPVGVTHLGSNRIVWSNNIQYMEMTFTNMDGWTVYVDELRRAAKAKPVIVIGFDSAGVNYQDDNFVTLGAPLFQSFGLKSYVTIAGIDVPFSGGPDWNRRITLHDKYGWDVVPHTWNHGGTVQGSTKGVASLARASNVVTVHFSSAHPWPVGTVFKGNFKGATTYPELNGTFTLTVTTTTDLTYTCAGTDFSTGVSPEAGTVTIRTYLSEVINADTPEMRAICDHEVGDIVRLIKGTGFASGAAFLPFPNNSVPHLGPLQATCNSVGVKLGRAYRGGFCNVHELGIDNPLHFGSFELGSGTSPTQLSYLRAKLAAAVERGEHIHFYGHYICDETQYAPGVVALEYPPGAGGNPMPANITAGGGNGAWWVGSLKILLQDIRALVDSGQALYMIPSELVAYLGLNK